VIIRRCERADLDALVWSPELAADGPVIAWASGCAAAGAMIMLVADAGGPLVGQVWIDLVRKRPVAVLWALRVRDGWRGRGIGRALVAAAERAAASAGAWEAELAVSADNPRARELYERLGYRVVGREDAVHAVTGLPYGVLDLLRRPLR
jgi:ribosomal protein S18 acetylase RimI-like enzyme